LAERYDLVIRSGNVVTTGSAAVADLGISGGTIVQIGGPMSGEKEIDAAGLLVLPGGVDAHVHLTVPEEMLAGPQWCDDFVSGSRAAAAGGITSIGNMVFPRGDETLVQAMEREAAEAEAKSIVDVFLHPVLTNPAMQPISDVTALAAEGHTSLKFFMSFGGFAADPAPYIEAMRLAKAANVITLIHCEDEAMIRNSTEFLMANGKTKVANYPASRPIVSEVAAADRAIAFAELTGAAIYIVHLSSEAALSTIRDARARHEEIYVETRPLYLHLTEERFSEPDGEKYVGQPPLRRQSDRDALWHGLAQGEVTTVCTDHAPWLYEHKVFPGADLTSIRPGVADLETMLPMLFSEGVVKRGLSLQRFVEVSSTNAAKLFGLYPRKGAIAVGSDADLALWDPNLTKAVTAAGSQTKADYSPYEGWGVTGWPVVTVSRGEVVFDRGQVNAAPGRGVVLKRNSYLAV
jgi:dihydropyrimidinase